MRDSFIFYRSFAEAIRELEPEQKAQLIDGIIDYALDDKEPDIKGVAKAMFSLIRPQIDANNKRYENGKRGGRPKKDSNQEETEEKPKRNQNETKTKPNVNVNVNVNENVNHNANENGGRIEELRKRMNIEPKEFDKRLNALRERRKNE